MTSPYLYASIRIYPATVSCAQKFADDELIANDKAPLRRGE